MKPRIAPPNLCLRCWHYYEGRCTKQPTDYCLITRSTTLKTTTNK